ncbi:MAG TPA: O-antigen ligase family protein, partial [Planctomycetota bacterium]|nr:O-antigen ligase family protein [Planctomycetota bacterium]
WPALPHARGERVFVAFIAWLGVGAAVNLIGQLLGRSDTVPLSFQPWDATYRLAHWLALLLVLRLGAAVRGGLAAPLAILLLLTSLFGLLQRLGLGEFAGYGAVREPVSVFGNLNVASEWTAVAAMAVAVLPPATARALRGWLTPAALVLAAAYLVVNQSRSGLIALPLGLLPLCLLRARTGGWRALAYGLGGTALGLVLAAAVARPEPADLAAANAEQKRGTATLDVRLEIAKGSTKLLAEAPVFGHGPGQFAVQYPRVRSQAEIETSSHGRQFATEVRTAHDDWLELLVDGGFPALLLFAASLFALQRAVADKARLLPMFVLMSMMLVRAPLGNAPAVAVAFLLAGTAGPAPRAARWRRPVSVLAGLAAVSLGVLPIAANTLFAPYVRARALGEQPPIAAVNAAAACMPFEPRWLQVQAQEQLIAGDLRAAARTAARAVELRPFEPQYYLQVGEALARIGQLQQAERIAQYALRIDPPNPVLRVLLATVLAQQQQADEAIAAVVHDPHPVLRAQLPHLFHQLADLAAQHDDAAGAARFRVEQHFLEAAENLGDPSPTALTAASEHVKAMFSAMAAAGTLRTDLRGFLMSALHALDLGDTSAAIDLGGQAQKLGIGLPRWQRELLGDKLAPLERVEAWHDVLARR